MKPNGLVAAASMTSRMFTPSRRPMMANSLASAMFTLRKVFSYSLASSATLGLETSSTRVMTCP